jgi:MFS family permease
VRSQPWLWATLAGASLSLLAFWGPLEVLVPYVIRNGLGGGAGDYGAVLAATGVGAVAGGLALGQFGLPARNVVFMYVSWTVDSGALVGFAAASATWQMLLCGFVAGAGSSGGNLVWTTLMQTRVPPELLGRVTSLDFFVSVGLTPVSFAVVGPLAAGLGARATLLAAGVASGIGLLAFLPLALRAPARQVTDHG